MSTPNLSNSQLAWLKYCHKISFYNPIIETIKNVLVSFLDYALNTRAARCVGRACSAFLGNINVWTLNVIPAESSTLLLELTKWCASRAVAPKN